MFCLGEFVSVVGECVGCGGGGGGGISWGNYPTGSEINTGCTHPLPLSSPSLSFLPTPSLSSPPFLICSSNLPHPSPSTPPLFPSPHLSDGVQAFSLTSSSTSILNSSLRSCSNSWGEKGGWDIQRTSLGVK